MVKVALKEIDEDKENYTPIREWLIEVAFPQVPAKGDKMNIFIENENVIFEVREVIYYVAAKGESHQAEVELLLARQGSYVNFVKSLMEPG